MNYTEEQIKEIVKKVISEMSNVSLENLSREHKNNIVNNPNTPPETLTLLANDEAYEVRRGVACNPNTPPEALERLANDEAWYVRWRVAMNTNTPPETLARLADDEDSDVRFAATNNPNYNKKITVTLTLTQKQLDELQKSGSYSFKLS
jgi:hypothetical protein